MIRRVVVFGASGDLARRYLLPALAELHAAKVLPDDFELLGVARQQWTDAEFRRHAAEALDRRATNLAPAERVAFTARLRYRPADLSRPAVAAAGLAALGADPIVAYLALPPTLFAPTVELLGAAAPAGSRLVVEKPFGESLASARVLNRLLHERFPEGAIFRMDHFLGKQTVQNVLGLRFANRLFEPVWNSQHVDWVEIVWDETKTAHGRAGYYDRAGALRDMVQNHLLQLMALVAMEVPPTLGARDLRDRKVDVLRAVRRPSPAEVDRQTVRGRYGCGHVDSQRVSAYVQEPEVEPGRRTETFAQVTLWVDSRRGSSWCWKPTRRILAQEAGDQSDRHESHPRRRDAAGRAEARRSRRHLLGRGRARPGAAAHAGAQPRGRQHPPFWVYFKGV